jgi:hypothetical protein
MYEGALRSIGGGSLADGMRFAFRLDLTALLCLTHAFGQIQISCSCAARTSVSRDCDCLNKDSDHLGGFSVAGNCLVGSLGTSVLFLRRDSLWTGS